MAFMGMVFAAGVILILIIINVITVIELVIGILLYMTNHKKSGTVLFILSGIPIVAALIAIVFFIYIIRYPQYESDHGKVTLNKSWIEKEKKLLKEHNNEGLTKLLNKHPDLIWYIDINHVNLLEYGLFNCDVELMQIAYDRGLRFDDPRVYDHMIYACTLDGFYTHLGYPSTIEEQVENYPPGVTTDEIIEALRFAIEHGAQTEWGHNGTSSETSIYSRAEYWVNTDGVMSEKDCELLSMLENK